MMTFPELSSKGCGLDLTLAGSQVTFASHIKCIGGNVHGSENIHHLRKLSASSETSKGNKSSNQSSAAETLPTKRFGLLPPFQANLSNANSQQNTSVPCSTNYNNSKEIADLCHKLTCNAFSTGPVNNAINVWKENSMTLDRTNSCHSVKLTSPVSSQLKPIRPNSIPSSQTHLFKPAATPSEVCLSPLDDSCVQSNVPNFFRDLSMVPPTVLTQKPSSGSGDGDDVLVLSPLPLSTHEKNRMKKKGRRKRKRSLKSAGKSSSSRSFIQSKPDQICYQQAKNLNILEANCSAVRVIKPTPKLTNTNACALASGDLVSNFLRKTVPLFRGVKQEKEEIPRVTKVYLSDKQSGMLKELGHEVPCAPPATPLPELHKHLEYVASMTDIRSQRALKSHLDSMDKAVKLKEKLAQEEQAKQDKINMKEEEKLKRKNQRLEIYALNKAMTTLEHKNFEEFCAQNGISCKV